LDSQERVETLPFRLRSRRTIEIEVSEPQQSRGAPTYDQAPSATLKGEGQLVLPNRADVAKDAGGVGRADRLLIEKACPFADGVAPA
jgi:hypothetical protein